uniref:Uncharacterized protein n=1 Tax=Rhizophora mucronata TaxID=61149 RepID=A0A2P2MD31_RHIMU
MWVARTLYSSQLQHPKLYFCNLSAIYINLRVSIASICTNGTPNIQMSTYNLRRLLSFLSPETRHLIIPIASRFQFLWWL